MDRQQESSSRKFDKVKNFRTLQKKVEKFIFFKKGN